MPSRWCRSTASRSSHDDGSADRHSPLGRTPKARSVAHTGKVRCWLLTIGQLVAAQYRRVSNCRTMRPLQRSPAASEALPTSRSDANHRCGQNRRTTFAATSLGYCEALDPPTRASSHRAPRVLGVLCTLERTRDGFGAHEGPVPVEPSPATAQLDPHPNMKCVRDVRCRAAE